MSQNNSDEDNDHPTGLRANIKLKNKDTPPGPDRKRPKTHNARRKMTIRTTPRDPRRRGGGQRQKQTLALNTAGANIRTRTRSGTIIVIDDVVVVVVLLVRALVRSAVWGILQRKTRTHGKSEDQGSMRSVQKPLLLVAQRSKLNVFLFLLVVCFCRHRCSAMPAILGFLRSHLHRGGRKRLLVRLVQLHGGVVQDLADDLPVQLCG